MVLFDLAVWLYATVYLFYCHIYLYFIVSYLLLKTRKLFVHQFQANHRCICSASFFSPIMIKKVIRIRISRIGRIRTFLFEAGAASGAEILPSSSSKVKEATSLGKLWVQHVETHTRSAKVLGAALVRTGFSLEADAAGFRTTLARESRDAQVEVGFHLSPVCVGCVDAGAHPLPFFRATIIFAGDRRVLRFAAGTGRIRIG